MSPAAGEGSVEAEIPVKELTDAELADRFAEKRLLWKAWQPNVNPHKQKYEELAAELLARQVKEPPEKQLIIEGTKWKVPISPCENKRTIIKPVALYRRFKKLGERKFLQLYKITLGAIDKAIPDEKERRRYVKEERTGAREIREPVLKEAR